MKKRFLILVFSLILTLSFVSAAQKIIVSSSLLPISINKVIIDNNIQVLVESKNLNKVYIMFDVKSQDGTTKRYFSSPKLLNSYEAVYFELPLEVENPTYLYATPYHSSGSTITLYEFSKEIYTFSGFEYKTITTSTASQVSLGQTYSTITTTSSSNSKTDNKVLYVNGVQKIEDDKVEYLHQDYLGSTRRASDSVSGEQVLSSDYYYFGGLLKTYGYSSNYLSSGKKAFTSKEQDSSDLYYFGARYYNPLIGRFVSVDPVYTSRESTYVYSRNNPIIFVDKTGKRPEPSVNSLRAGAIGVLAGLSAISGIVRGDSFRQIVKNAAISGAAGAVSFEAKGFVGRNPTSDLGFLAASKVVNIASSVGANAVQGKGAFDKITLTYLNLDINIKDGGIKPAVNLVRTVEIAGSAMMKGNKFEPSTTLMTGVAQFTRSDFVSGGPTLGLLDLPTPGGGAITTMNSLTDSQYAHSRIHNLDFVEVGNVLGEGVQLINVPQESQEIFGVPVNTGANTANAIISGGVLPYAAQSTLNGKVGDFGIGSIMNFWGSDAAWTERNANVLSE